MNTFSLSRRTLLGGLLTLLMLAPPIYCFFQNCALADPRVLRVVMDDNFPPYVFRDGEGKLGGILVDQWALWQKKTGVKVQITAKDWAVAQSEMQASRHDVIDTIFQNPDRDKIYDFSKPHARLDTVIFFNKNLPGLTDLKSLRGFNVGVKGGGHSTTVLKNAGIGIIEFDNYEGMVLAARDSNLLIFIMEKQPGLYFLYKHGLGDHIHHSEPLYHGEFRRAVRKGDAETLRLVEAGFAQISRSEYAAIDRKWLGITPGEPGFDFKQVIIILVAGISLTVVLVGWNWALRRTVRRKTIALSASEKKYRELMINLAIGVIVHDSAGKPSFWNTTALEELGLTGDQIAGTDKLPANWEYLSGEGTRLDSALTPVRIVLRTAEALCNYTMGIHRPDGTEKWFQVDAFPDFDEQDRIEQVVVTFSNVTERRQTEQRLIYISFHDGLTGVYNRSYFEEELQRLQHRRTGQLAIAVVDVDGLKLVNDNWGHSVGDELLVQAAQLLRRAVRQEDVVARIGGDEFAIILRNTEEAMVVKIFDRLHLELEREEQRADSLPPLRLSFGYAFALSPETAVVELFKTADNRMYQEKVRRKAARKFNEG